MRLRIQTSKETKGGDTLENMKSQIISSGSKIPLKDIDVSQVKALLMKKGYSDDEANKYIAAHYRILRRKGFGATKWT